MIMWLRKGDAKRESVNTGDGKQGQSLPQIGAD